MAIIGDVKIKVSTDVLVNKADAVSHSIRQMQDCFDEMEGIISRTVSYWIGDAGDLHRQLYVDEIPNIEEMMKRLKEHPRDLNAIARNYTDVEQRVSEISNALSGNVIE